jgi:spore coat polysaccharide biosynthesis protein SpsF
LDVEVFTVEALRRAAAEATSDYDREHVTPWLYRPEAPFRRGDLVQAEDQSAFRWTVDLPGDFTFVERVYAALYPGNPAFTSADILALPFARRESDV